MTLSTWPWWIPWHGLVGGGLLTTDDYLSNKVYSLSDSLQIERLLLRRETERVPRNGTQMNLSFMDGTIGYYIVHVSAYLRLYRARSVVHRELPTKQD
jgi:hypothetical protein